MVGNQGRKAFFGALQNLARIEGFLPETFCRFRAPALWRITAQASGIFMIYVCSLADLHSTVESSGATHILTVMGKVEKAKRPASVREANHMLISMDDITETAEGFTAPSLDLVEQALDFVREWDRAAPLVIHCFAGISRSTASAFMTACALNPHRDEIEIAKQIRAASASASPNRLIVTLADRALGRDGRMVRALDAMGPGSMTIEGRPFRIDIE